MAPAASPAAGGLILRDPFPASDAPMAREAQAPLAPWPLIDRNPLVIGAGLTMSYASTVLRLATTGYRREFVDLARELLERDGATKSLLSGRFATVAGGRADVIPADVPKDHADRARAEELAAIAKKYVIGLPSLKQALLDLGWGVFYGVSAAEIGWKRADGLIVPERLFRIANRRIAYPDSMSWDPHVWDQGNVLGPRHADRPQPTSNAAFGLNLARCPNKFVLHTPAFAADYPTREGLARELMSLMIFKILGIRCGASFVERFSRIIFWASYTTGTKESGPRIATSDDVDAAYASLTQLGLGVLAGSALPDSIQLHTDGPATSGDTGTKLVESWVEMMDAQISKVVRGSTFTTQPGRNVGRGVAESGELTERQIEKFDADALSETITRDLLGAFMRVNFPDELHLCPRFVLHLDDPTPATILKLAIDAASCGVPVDADAVAEQVGLQVTPNESGEPRRMAPLGQVTIPATELGDMPEPEPLPIPNTIPPGDTPADPSADGGEPGNDNDQARPRAAAELPT